MLEAARVLPGEHAHQVPGRDRLLVDHNLARYDKAAEWRKPLSGRARYLSKFDVRYSLEGLGTYEL